MPTKENSSNLSIPDKITEIPLTWEDGSNTLVITPHDTSDQVQEILLRSYDEASLPQKLPIIQLTPDNYKEAITAISTLSYLSINQVVMPQVIIWSDFAGIIEDVYLNEKDDATMLAAIDSVSNNVFVYERITNETATTLNTSIEFETNLEKLVGYDKALLLLARITQRII